MSNNFDHDEMTDRDSSDEEDMHSDSVAEIVPSNDDSDPEQMTDCGPSDGDDAHPDAAKTTNDCPVESPVCSEDVESPEDPLPDLTVMYADLKTEMMELVKRTMVETTKDLRKDVLSSTMVDIAIFREKYKELCKSIRKDIDQKTTHEILDSFECFEIDITNVLQRSLVEVYNDEVFNPKRQKVVGFEYIDGEDKTILESYTEGYAMDGKVLYPQQVKVGRHKTG